MGIVFHSRCHWSEKAIWIGLRKDDESNCGLSCRTDWYWTDGTPANYNRWSASEPVTESGPRCAILSFDGLWYSKATTDEYKFACLVGKHFYFSNLIETSNLNKNMMQ